MAMTKRAENSEVCFTAPIAGPRDYVVKGLSGWPETFRRKIVDTQLDKFLRAVAPTIEVDELIDVFIARRELTEDPEPTTWHTIVGFLARTINLHPHDIPPECTISLWGRIVLAQRARKES